MPIFDRNASDHFRTAASGQKSSPRSLSLEVDSTIPGLNRRRKSTHTSVLGQLLPSKPLDKTSKNVISEEVPSSILKTSQIPEESRKNVENKVQPNHHSKRYSHHQHYSHHPSHPNYHNSITSSSSYHHHHPSASQFPTSFKTSSLPSIEPNQPPPHNDTLTSYTQATKNSIEDRIPPILIEEDEAITSHQTHSSQPSQPPQHTKSSDQNSQDPSHPIYSSSYPQTFFHLQNQPSSSHSFFNPQNPPPSSSHHPPNPPSSSHHPPNPSSSSSSSYHPHHIPSSSPHPQIPPSNHDNNNNDTIDNSFGPTPLRDLEIGCVFSNFIILLFSMLNI